MNAIGAAWLVFAASATWRWEKANPKSLPRPGIYVGSAAVYSLLLLAGTNENARRPAALFGWALVISELVGGSLIPGSSTGALTPGAQSVGQSSGQSSGQNPALFGAVSGLGVSVLPGAGPNASLAKTS